MVYNKQIKVAFVCSPRTGSTTLHSYLNGQGWFRLKEKHHSLEALVKLYPNLTEYKTYGFFRNPLARFESCVLYAKQEKFFAKVFEYRLFKSNVNKTSEEVTYDDVVDRFNEIFDFGGFLFKPQTFWFDDPRVTALDFHNMRLELERIIGPLPEEIPTLNKSSDFGRSVITDKVRDFVRNYYATDYQFAKNVLGKEY